MSLTALDVEVLFRVGMENLPLHNLDLPRGCDLLVQIKGLGCDFCRKNR